ncbi:uncharacterized protein LOC107006408 [Solanum pennellii]|uniref:Uncharacterized protein LOC107006408 n=1 Tax=Solanum pennellii TaxID=28526 RepID=A0ABM1FQZ8_SOLPN|nr:uncharacterized protein LOC107006408 [Solanum pennellii]
MSKFAPGTPMDANMKLTSRQYYEHTGQNQEELLTDKITYQKLIGKLLYLNMTRLGISFSVQTLSYFLHQPKKSHIDAALRVIKYIKRQSGQGILLSSDCRNEVTAFCDADWVACTLTRKSVIGYVIKFGNSLIYWKAKNQTIVSRSSVEAKYRSIASNVTELIWLIGLLKDLKAEVH